MTETIGPMEDLGLWLALLSLIATPNSPNRGYNPPPVAHPPLIHATRDITVVVKKVA